MLKELGKIEDIPSLPSQLFEQAKRLYEKLPSFPACDIFVDKDSGNLNFEIALPGYDLKDIDVSFENDYMIVEVSPENRLKKEQKNNVVFFKKSLKRSSFSFEVPVPFSRFEVDKAKAYYHNGILIISIPRLPSSMPRKIPVKLKEEEIDSGRSKATLEKEERNTFFKDPTPKPCKEPDPGF
jgi:HSP20 family molecular chaperone IbpA